MVPRKAISMATTTVLLVCSASLFAAQSGAMAQEETLAAGGRIVFSAQEDARCCERDIYAVDVGATSEPARLTNEPGYDFSPSVSPDGSWIAWQRGGEVWKMRADGSGKTRVVADESPEDPPEDPYAGDAVDPAWSPDGSEIAFVRDGDIWAVGADGSGQRRITQGDELDAEPAWAPEGERLAFSRVYASGSGYTVPEILVADASDGSGATSISGEVSLDGSDEPDWSQDGTEVAFAGWGFSAAGDWQGQIFVARADGSGARRVLGGEPQDISDVVYGNPSYSPDGSRIAYTGDGGIFIADPDGTDRELAYNAGSGQTLFAEDIDWGPKPPLPTTSPPCTIKGTRGNDFLKGTTANDVICGKGGSDIVVDYKGGNDTLLGDGGKDILLDTKGRGLLRGGDANDVLFALDDAPLDTMNGQAGNDFCVGDMADMRKNCERGSLISLSEEERERLEEAKDAAGL